MPKKINEEAAPLNDDVRIGIELEGVGTVKTVWKDKKIIKKANFHDVFKRTPLVRSNSFSDSRGVYITPEDSGDFGISGPAELVSSPHVLDAANLDLLRNSVKKALKNSVEVPNLATGKTKTVMNPMRARPHEAKLKDKRLPDTDKFQNTVATTRWAINPSVKIAGNIQTTVGVAASKLLSNTEETRNGVVQLLIGDPTKKQYAKDLLYAAVQIEGYLTAVGHLLQAYSAKKVGIRLAVFMYLVNHFAGGLAEGAWAKTALGANFKGTTSFRACNVAGNDDLIAQAVLAGPDSADAIKADMIADLEANHVADWITKGMADADFDIEEIGLPGQSLQTSVEAWFAIDNFTHNNRLYTVIESREKTSTLNIKMCEFLKGSAKTDAQVFYNFVKTFVVA
ncbi:hypothetical protein [Andreprevotia chitinilytica]|uniref:hypothetical protein n=1 Tax=Andreprevotia chitinilytica TaxID=396808 RepID=UPI00054E378D|nr:hypothetical protein [Andreprevotia chitinilytica]